MVANSKEAGTLSTDDKGPADVMFTEESKLSEVNMRLQARESERYRIMLDSLEDVNNADNHDDAIKDYNKRIKALQSERSALEGAIRARNDS